MKRLPIIVLTLALCLLTAGCGAKPNEPDDGDSAKAEIVERMAAVKAAEIKYISSFFSREHVNAEDTASVLNAAAEHRSEQSGQGLDHYTMEIYLSGGPDAYSSSDEHFVFFAGLDENHINGIYFNGKGDSSRMSFEDETLYWLIRNGYRTEVQVDKDAYEYHQAILDQRAQRLAAQCASPSRTDILTGYEVVQFYQKEVLTDESGSYTVYCWEPAFLTASPDDIPWAGGMYLDADGRLCAYEQYTYFVTKGNPETSRPTASCRWICITGKPKKREKSTLCSVSGRRLSLRFRHIGRRMCWTAFPITTRFPSVRQSRWPGCCFPASMP